MINKLLIEWTSPGLVSVNYSALVCVSSLLEMLVMRPSFGFFFFFFFFSII